TDRPRQARQHVDEIAFTTSHVAFPITPGRTIARFRTLLKRAPHHSSGRGPCAMREVCNPPRQNRKSLEVVTPAISVARADRRIRKGTTGVWLKAYPCHARTGTWSLA